MRCRVLYFASLAESTGMREATFDLADGASVHDAIDRIAAAHPGLASQLKAVATAVNETYVSRNTALTDGCILALIPPVSGG